MNSVFKTGSKRNIASLIMSKQLRGWCLAVGLSALVASTRTGGLAAAFTVGLAANIDRPMLRIDAGDSITWINHLSGSNAVISYSTAWRGGVLTNYGDTVSAVFSLPGEFPYATTGSGYGLVTVAGWTDAPPAVELNWPIDGFVFGGFPYRIQLQATVRLAATNVAAVDFWADTNLIGRATNGPYDVLWEGDPSSGLIAPGEYRVRALVTEVGGRQYQSSSVRVAVRNGGGALSLPRRLPDGSFMACYSVEDAWGGYVAWYDAVPLGRKRAFYPFTLIGDGVFVDTTAGSGDGRRYYILSAGQGPPP